ncbi:hypothetical protein V6N12_042287 [Hibiscus sabdariffa]|uniref:Uncharacterized protein n=1 Tax=Hibiscus sabdariffa TaxID=183260 RepID=A0ABR2EEC0_9ROSI
MVLGRAVGFVVEFGGQSSIYVSDVGCVTGVTELNVFLFLVMVLNLDASGRQIQLHCGASCCMGNQVATEVERHEGFKPADAGSTNEQRGGRGEAILTGRRWKRKRSHLAVIEFDDRRVNPDGGQELFHDVTHATRRSAEDDDGVLRYHPPESRLRRLILVYGETAADGDGGGGGAAAAHGGAVGGRGRRWW